MRIDAHQHFWHYDPVEYDWIGDNDNVLKRDFLPANLIEVSRPHQLDGSIAVQARQSEEETNWLLSLAQANPFIKGVVGWVDLRSPALESMLACWRSNTKLKGFRHVLQGEREPDFMLQPDFIRGVSLLHQHDYTYDLLIFAHQLPQVLELLEALPSQRLVIDHIAKPSIATGDNFDAWKTHMYAIAKYGNVYCKVSGMVTEADHNQWSEKTFWPYLDVIFDAFGVDRLLFGSDWPVCQLAATYTEVFNLVDTYVKRTGPAHAAQIFGLNAKRFYRL